MSTMRTVPFAGGKAQEHATLLLAAADDLGLEPEVVRTVSDGFVVPQEVLDKAGLEDAAVPEDDAEEEVPSGNSEPEEPKAKAPAKKAAAKKTAAKKSARS